MRNILVLFALLLFLTPSIPVAQNVKTYIPTNAKKYIGVVREEVSALAPTTRYPEYYPGLIEHESCLSLTHKRCFEPSSQLLTAKEQGVGLGQITRTFNKDGTVKADYLSDLRARHMKHLRELSWDNVTQRPDLQVRGIVLMVGDNLKTFWQIEDEYIRYQFADAAYNGGPGHTKKERLQCGLTKGCNPQLWFGNVAEIRSIKGQKPLYGTRSPWDINRHHVYDVFNNRMPKYKALMTETKK